MQVSLAKCKKNLGKEKQGNSAPALARQAGEAIDTSKWAVTHPKEAAASAIEVAKVQHRGPRHVSKRA